MCNRGSWTRPSGVAVAILVVLVSSSQAQQMTSGPVPPPGTDRGLRAPSRAQVILTEVPAYIWHHGCGPTAIGMVIGYYDTHGYGDLVPGSAATQTPEVDAMIADDGGSPDCALPDGDHYQDYSCPRDDYGPVLADRSQTGGAHSSNCVADFMRTSWSLIGNRYGWAYGSDVVPAFYGYVTLVSAYWSESVTRPFSQFSWTAFRAEMDAGRPVGLLVDTDGNGQTDHFVTAIGYNTDTNEYACRDTWDTGIHWFDWSAMSYGNPWGIYNATTYYFYPLPDLTIVTLETRPGTPVCMDSVEARAAVVNQGEGDADWFGVQFLCDDNPVANCFVPPLSHGEAVWTDWTSLGSPGEGNHGLLACADADRLIAEGDETNNCHSKRLAVEPCPSSAVPPDGPAPAETSPISSANVRLSVPNPYQVNQWITLESASSGNAVIAVYDAVGRRVRMLFSAPIGKGRQVLRWDGRSESGDPMPSGVYFVQAVVGAGRSQRTLVFQR